jgi:Ser/Thr protein kinase RdoA (MazF antagonist)
VSAPVPPRPPREAEDFHDLTPSRVLGLVEDSYGLHLDSVCRPLASYINRVYELQSTDGEPWVVKFYRPGRWTDAAIRDELIFTADLDEAEVPVVPAVAGVDDRALQVRDGLRFILMPRRRGRAWEDPGPGEWKALGQLLARIHNTGGERPARHRVTWRPAAATAVHLDEILDGGIIGPDHLATRYEDLVAEFIDRADPLFDGVEFLRIHGDCHANNLLSRPGEGLRLIDFDDMCNGPAAQDLWMLLPGRAADCPDELEALMEGYTFFRDFPSSGLRLFESLRVMRIVHFTAWCARQIRDGGAARLDPTFATDGWWAREVIELEQHIQRAYEDL